MLIFSWLRLITNLHVFTPSTVFNYGPSHGVDVVSKDDYDSCNTGNALQVFTGGQTTIPLSTPGDMYFICSTSGHCDTGMKLAIKVQGSSSGTTPATPSGSGATPAKSNHPNAASGVFGSMSKLVVGISVVFGALFVFMG